MIPSAAIIDASVALKWAMPEPDSDKAHALRAGALFAPDLRLVECGNALWSASRRGIISTFDAETRLQKMSELPIGLTAAGTLTKSALSLALVLGHPIYGCIYLALAVDTDLPLVTADQRFLKSLQPHHSLTARVMYLADLP